MMILQCLLMTVKCDIARVYCMNCILVVQAKRFFEIIIVILYKVRKFVFAYDCIIIP